MDNHPVHHDKDLPAHSVEQLIENQSRELELRAEELSLKKQEDDHGFEFGKIALEAKIKDRGECRIHERKKTVDRYYFSAFIFTALVVAILTSLLNGHENIAMEMVKAIIYISAGALGGWGVAKKRPTTPEEDSQ